MREPFIAPGSFAALMERRFEAYKAHVVRPFFRDHFQRIDRQIVLVDVLAAIDAGPVALDVVRRQLDHLRKYSQALITGGVTGKLDVTKERAA